MQHAFLKKTLLSVFAIFLLASAYAQFEEGKQDLTQIGVIPGNQSFPATNKITVLNTIGESSKKIQNIIRLKFNELAPTSSAPGAPLVYFKSGFTATVNLTVDVWVSAANGSNAPDQTLTPSTPLTVTYDPAAGAKYNPIAYWLLNNTTGYEIVRVNVASITVSGLSNGWTTNDVLPLLTVENEMRVLRYFTNPTLPAPAITPTYDATYHPDQLSVSWPLPAQANTSQLEYAWVENETRGFYSVNGTFDTGKLFSLNSTRVDIDTSNQVFNIPLLYDADAARGGGTLYYRVRSAYRKNDGSVITGDWLAPQTFAYNGHQPNMNWQSSTSFAENGKSKTVIQYFDGSLRPRQTVTKDNSTGNTTVSETIYDLQGRPNVQILPTPTMSTAIQYFSDFNRFAGQTTNDDPAKYFDLAVAGNQCVGAPQLDTTVRSNSNGGNGLYYSYNNPWKGTESSANFIPDAKGYAYTETKYTDDPTQRVRVQGGVGEAFQIGKGHTTNYFYGKPNQSELDALFGTEVGDASHYFKNMVQDANGQMSVSYVDMHGRTIATALAGNAPTGLSDISTNAAFYPASSGLLTNQLITPSTNIIKGDSIENISTLLVPANTLYNFTYQLTPAILQQLNCNQQQICFDCKYNLDISIRQEGCNTAPIVRHYSNLQIVPANQACGTPMGFVGENITTPATQIGFSQQLGVGSWVVRKTLSINDSMFRVRKDSALNAFLCKTQQAISDSVFTALSASTNCSVPPATRNCSACQALLGNSYADNNYHYKQNYIASVGGTPTLSDAQIHALYTQDSLECADACGLLLNPALSSLNVLRNQMLNDMIPYQGQYAVLEDSLKKRYGTYTYVDSLVTKYDIFATSSGAYGSISGETKPYYKHPDGLYNNDGITDRSIYPGGTSGSSILDTLSADNFAGMFNRGWVEQLLYFHPEYPKLSFAKDHLTDVYAWQDRVAQCNSYQTAVDSGYILPINKDPYFKNTGFVPSDKSKMNTYLINTINSNQPGFSIWEIANASVLCDSTLPSGEYSACLTGLNYDNDGIDADAVTTAQKDAVWQSFRTSYLSYRNEMVTAYINSQTTASLSSAAMTELQKEGKQLRFAVNADVATQNGWTWWSYATSANPNQTVLANMTNTYVLANTGDKCTDQRPLWRGNLLQCEVLQQYLMNQTNADTVKVNTIINLILDSMVMVCHKSIDASNPGGASNVNPVLMPQTPANFEDIVNHVFTQNGIATLPGNNYFCNPYSVDYPKPYGSNPPLFVINKASVDTCNCKQFSLLKVSAKTEGYDTTSLISMNQYLLSNYGDTLTSPLWQGLLQCHSHDWFGETTCYWRRSTDVHSPIGNKGNANTNTAKSGRGVITNVSTGPPCTPPTLGQPQITNITVTKPSQSASDGGNQTVTVYYTLPGNATSSVLWMDDIQSFAITGAPKVFSLPQCEIHDFYIVSTLSYTDCNDDPQTKTTYSDDATNNYCWVKDSCVTEYSNIGLGAIVTVPSFLNCGYVKPCITCDQLQAYTASFRILYPAYAGVPFTTNVDTGQAKQNALWARYLNYKTGFNKTANEYALALQNCGTTTTTTIPTNLLLTNRTTQPPTGTTQPQSYTAGSTVTFDDGYISAQDDYFQTVFDTTNGTGSTGNTTTVLCAFDKPVTYVALPDTTHSNPCAAVKQQAEFIGQLLFQQQKDSLIANFDSLYRAKCLSAQSTEVFYATYLPREYHYTLYYYDQAGNLVKTIPPAAVKPNFDATYLANVKAARASGTDNANTQNNEAMATQYRYNTLNAVIVQKSPDGGTSQTWYDRLGRLAVSQNAKQATANNYSYTLYDALGRMTEAGEKPQTQVMTQVISQDTTALKNWLAGGGNNEQITRTVYDAPYPVGIVTPFITQLNLRNRISYVQAIDADNTNVPPYRTATFYSYDIHGNIDTVLHDYGANSVMGATTGGNRFKLIKYDYDLISSKVNMISYQPNKADGYYQQYQYDAENRLTMVKTSRDSIQWEHDAAYQYYRHGPLARMELGELKAQGVDYAYTLQGALKGINSTSVGDGSFDIGNDGKSGSNNSYIARDVFGMSIDYYTNDYVPVNNSVAPFTSAGVGNNLYNGNIKGSIVNIPSLSGALAYAYQYDQLNRLVGMDAYTGINNATNAFTATGTNDYKERISYDPNGNILSYLRNGTGSQQILNNYSYNYVANKNQLQSIFNSVTGQTKTYVHDLIGSVTDDGMQGTQSVQWDVYNRVQNLQNKDGKAVTYTYDASGYRISKAVNGTTEWYVRTTEGSILATYVQGDNTKNNGQLTQTEVHLEGNTHIGIVNVSLNCTNLTVPSQTVFTRAEKNYEVSDYRGNVIVTISDKKLQHTTNSTTVDYSNADIISANYYSAYGAVSKTLSTPTINGFNGQRRSSEISATAQTAQFWEYNGDVGRRWNMDLKLKPYYSAYASFANNPINFIDPDGADTLKVQGANNSQWTVYWGKGTKSTSFDMNKQVKPYIPDATYNKCFDIGNASINLDDLFPTTPDVVGLDLYGGANAKFIAGGGGLNLLWHTRGADEAGEGKRPELHLYHDAGVQGDFKNMGIGVSASLVAGWAEINTGSQSQPALPAFVTNGVNWTGNFNVVNGSFTVGKLWGKADVSVGVSKFSSLPFGSNGSGGEPYWWGYTVGVGLSGSINPTKAKGFGDIIKTLDKTTFGLHQQYYYMMYGNGGDRLNNGEDVSGWHIKNPIDPTDNK